MPQQTPLHDVTTRDGAAFVEDAGFLVPEHFGDADAEYRAAREGAVMFDVTPRGKLEVTGKDAGKFLHNLSTNDILTLRAGAGCEALFCTAKARVVGHVSIFHTAQGGESVFWLDTVPGQNGVVLKHLDHFLISEDVQFTDHTTELVKLHVAGRDALHTLEKATVGDTHRVRWLTDPGFDLLCTPERAAVAWERLKQVGCRPSGLRTYHTLRVEAGTPMFGPDIDENRFVAEVNRTTQAISYAKGCYLGQEPIVMARDRGHVNRLLLGLKLSGGDAVPHGSKVFRDGNEIGQTTSSVVSPRFGPIALAYLRRGHWEPGTAVEVETSAGRTTAVVSSLPFGD